MSDIKFPTLKSVAVKAEYELIIQVLNHVKYSKTIAANILGVDRKTLYNKIQEYEKLQASYDV